MKAAALALLASRKFLISFLTVMGTAVAAFMVRKGLIPADQLTTVVGAIVAMGVIMIGAIAHEDAAASKALAQPDPAPSTNTQTVVVTPADPPAAPPAS